MCSKELCKLGHREVLEVGHEAHPTYVRSGCVHLASTELSSMHLRNEDVWKDFPADHKSDYDRDDGIIGYAWMARYTWKFLDAYLKADLDTMAFLKRPPGANGVPKHYLATEFRPAQGKRWRFRLPRVEAITKDLRDPIKYRRGLIRSDPLTRCG